MTIFLFCDSVIEAKGIQDRQNFLPHLFTPGGTVCVLDDDTMIAESEDDEVPVFVVIKRTDGRRLPRKYGLFFAEFCSADSEIILTEQFDLPGFRVFRS